jgi:hypothetical protein
MRSGISIICAADVTGFGFVFVSGSYRELVAYRQAAPPLWLRDCGFYPVSMGARRRNRCRTTVSFIAPTRRLTLVTPTYGKPKPLLNGAARIGARIV